MLTFLNSSHAEDNLSKTYSELTVHFQPIFYSKDGKIYGYEALARHRSRNINVLEMFNNARVNGTLYFLDMICIRNALNEALSQRISEYLFINICPDTIMQSIYEKGLTERFVSELGFSKGKIVLEITENSIIENFNSLIKIVCQYKELGYKISIDNFGTGIEGLKLLSMINPDFIKINKEFVRTIHRNLFSKSVVDLILNTCHTHDIMVIADGIESYEQLSECVKLGVDYLQGYYLAKPQKRVFEFKLCYASQ